MVIFSLDEEKKGIAQGDSVANEKLLSFRLSPFLSSREDMFGFFRLSKAARRKRIQVNLQVVEMEKEEARSASADALVINLESHFEAQSQTHERVPFVFHKVIPV